MDKLNTHSYDGRWFDRCNDIKIYNNDNVLSFEDTIKDIKKDLQTFKHTDFNLIKSDVEKCVNLFITDKSNNKDKLNMVTVEELLPVVWCKVKHFDNGGKYIFYEQLADIVKGSCAQGRTTRLIQFLDM